MLTVMTVRDSAGIDAQIISLLLRQYRSFQIAEMLGVTWQYVDKVKQGARMADGRHGKKARGGHAGGSAPYGFTIAGNGKAAMLVPFEPEQKLVREIVELHAGGQSLRKIAAILAERGVKNRAGANFQPTTIARLLDAHAPRK